VEEGLGKSRKAKLPEGIGALTVWFGISVICFDARTDTLDIFTMPGAVAFAVSVVLISAGTSLWRNWRMSFILYICAVFAGLIHGAFRLVMLPAIYDFVQVMQLQSEGSKLLPFFSLMPILRVLWPIMIISTCITGLVISFYKEHDLMRKQTA
jgi:hypothetical protein